MEFYGVFVADWIWISAAVFFGLSLIYLMSMSQSDHMEINFFSLVGGYTGLWAIIMILDAASIDLFGWTQDFHDFLRGTWVPDYWMIPANWAVELVIYGDGVSGIAFNLLSPALLIGGWLVSFLIGPGIFVGLANWIQYKQSQDQKRY